MQNVAIHVENQTILCSSHNFANDLYTLKPTCSRIQSTCSSFRYRKWKTVNDSVTCMISQSDAPADLGYYWICYIFQPDKTTDSECSYGAT